MCVYFYVPLSITVHLFERALSLPFHTFKPCSPSILVSFYYCYCIVLFFSVFTNLAAQIRQFGSFSVRDNCVGCHTVKVNYCVKESLTLPLALISFQFTVIVSYVLRLARRLRWPESHHITSSHIPWHKKHINSHRYKHRATTFHCCGQINNNSNSYSQTNDDKFAWQT